MNKQKHLLSLLLLLFICGAPIFSSCTKEKTNEEQTISSVELNKTSLSLKVGATETLSVNILPEGISSEVLWSSENINVATVDESGLVTAIAEGSANITASVGSVTANCAVTVTKEISSDLDIVVPEEGSIKERLLATTIDGEKVVVSVKNQASSEFKERYMVTFEQPLDYNNPKGEKLQQRVLFGFKDFAKPLVFVTQGYDLDSWGFPESNYQDPLSEKFRANEAIVEHRFFGKSRPNNNKTGNITDWTHHTIENEIFDLHRINNVFRKFFKDQKVISTGRSKGGQTTIFFETYYPKDIDIAVPYVAPICYKLADRRPAEFLKKVGSKTRRDAIKKFQQGCFDKRATLVPLFIKKFAEWYNEDGYFFPKDFNNISEDKFFDLVVLEYSFMCWQHNPTASIPNIDNLSDYDIIYELCVKSNPTYFSFKSMPSFMVNVIHDDGYYTYDVEQFSNTVITQAECDRWAQDVTTTKVGGANKLPFNSALGEKTKKFLSGNTSEKMIFIYGAYDTWSSCAVDKAFFTGKSNMFRYDLPGGDHGTFIYKFNNSSEIYGKIQAWLNE